MRDFLMGCLLMNKTSLDELKRDNPMQDSLTKTIPIWAAVLNRAVAQVRRQQWQQQQQASPPAAEPQSLEQPSPPTSARGPQADGCASACGTERQDSAADWLQRPEDAASDCSGSTESCNSSSGGSWAGGSVAIIGKQPAVPGSSSSGGGGAGANAEAEAGADDSWDTGVHLPLWISANERQQIEVLLPAFVQQLLEVRMNFLPVLQKAHG